MKAELTGVSRKKSKYGNDFYYLFFKGDDGKSYKTCIYSNMRNFEKWKKYIILPRGSIIGNLRVKEKNLINADSTPKLIAMPKFNNEPKVKKVNKQKSLFDFDDLTSTSFNDV